MPFTGIGRVGCAACWETAIRNDERVTVECELPRDLVPDPCFVDEIAVELACEGKRPALTEAERTAAIARLLDEGLPRTQVAPKLNPRQQSHLVKLHHDGNHSIADLADLFSVSRPTVYRVLERARKQAPQTPQPRASRSPPRSDRVAPVSTAVACPHDNLNETGRGRPKRTPI